jgi:SpoVK/Ycf46/Vps4 family AAA+-type ATPase
MSGKSSVIDTLRSAHQANPDNLEIALHLASLLLKDAQTQAALPVYQQILSKQPANLDALNGALEASEKMGQVQLAKGYRRMLSAFACDQTKANENGQTKRPGPTKNSEVKLRVVGGQESGECSVEIEKPALTLDHVGGLESVKRRLQLSFLGPLQNPALMSAYGKSVDGGLLLYGPPGCGKTFIARALAGELGAKFISVELADILDMYLGESERRLHELFESARQSAPAVLFFDELDAIGQKRSHLRSSGLRTVVNQLLTEMDSVGSDNTNLYIIGATNHPWDLDTALKRPGRFDRMVAVFPPDPAARLSILSYHLRNKPSSGTDLKVIAHKCEGFSGADLKHLVDTAVEHVLERSLVSGGVLPVQQGDLLDAIKEIRPSTRSWFETARNYVFFANECGDYDDLMDYMRVQNL